MIRICGRARWKGIEPVSCAIQLARLSARALVEGGLGHLDVARRSDPLVTLTQIGKCRVPLFKTSLGHREVRLQLRPTAWVNGALTRRGGLEIALRFLKCRGLKCVLSCHRQITDQFAVVSE